MLFPRPLLDITSTSGHVYVLKHPYDAEWLKVGKVGNFKLVRSRLSSYNTGSPIRYTMPYIKPTRNQHEAEKAVHDTLVAAGIARKGEWFQAELETVVRCIDKQIDTNWPSDKPSFSLGDDDVESRAENSIAMAIIFAGIALILSYFLI